MKALRWLSVAAIGLGCGNGAAVVSPTPTASASSAAVAPSSSSTASIVPSPTASATLLPDAGAPADVRCEGRSCRVEKANERTFAELVAAHADLGDLWILAGHPKTLAPLAPLTKLYRFRIALCEGIVDKDFAFAKGWTELGEIEISNCDGFTSLAPLGTLPKLTTIAVVNTQLRSLEGLRGSPVTTLRVQSGVTDLAALESMPKLASLNLADLDGVHEAPVLAKLVHLEALELMAVDFTRLPDLSALTALKSLTVSHAPKLTELKGLAALPALTTLTLDWTGVTDLAALGRLDHVTFLHLEGTKVKDLTPLASWKSLGGVIVADDTSPALIAALTKAKPSMRAITAHQAALAAQGPGGPH